MGLMWSSEHLAPPAVPVPQPLALTAVIVCHINKSPACEALVWATVCGRADTCPSGTCWVSPAEVQFCYSLQGQPCEEGPAAEVVRGGRKQKQRGTWVAPWQMECHSPQVGRVPQRLGRPSGGLCSQVLSRIKVQSWKQQYVPM